MLASAAILAATVAIYMLEAPSLRRRKLRKELWVFTLLLLLGCGLGIAKSLQVPIPNPVDWIILVYGPLGDALYEWLK
ncbi:hypothetical protein ACFSL6_12930 [Paenibacillus thailandensis]|uniref:Uncharacterized protein n=1 Tax=Paenibacillus thailandensis TaxID=393250 RepID=A0ABW5R089_9BACL